ncbi:MAG: citrate lyase subunit alpha, partial [Sutterella wadsworthensis]|nr:citrate lyase subunit alpha [Sutterella wadsworthensis]
AAPSADAYGNINGVTGETACGSLGYAFPDADYADQVVAVTDNLQPYPLTPISISQERVDWVVELEKIGDPNGIVSGTTKVTKDPVQLLIAQNAAKAIAASGLLQNGFSLQTGAGGASLAAAAFIAEMMREKHVVGSFIMGGITGLLVKMLEEGLFKRILDVQDFDLEAVRSVRENPAHEEVGACLYASPFNSGCIVNQLDCAILGATEIDTDFNVNVLTGSAGAIMGGSGGHSDAAAGAKMTIITANLTRSRIAVIKDRVRTICTPGETVDVLVTEWGIAVNPRRTDLLERFTKAKLPVHSIEKLREKAERLCGKARPIPEGERIVGIVEYRDGTIIDVVRARA